MKQVNKLHPSSFWLQNNIQALAIAAVFLMATFATQGQQNLHSANYKGSITCNNKGITTDVELAIIDGVVSWVKDDSKNSSWFQKAKLVQRNYRDSIVLFWIYDCPVGKQTRIYTISNITSSGADITMRGLTVFYGDKRKIKDEKIEGTGFGNLRRLEGEEMVVRND